MVRTETLQVVLRIGKGKDAQELPFISGITPQQNLDHYSMNYPSLATASIGEPVVEGKKMVYIIEETLGTKG